LQVQMVQPEFWMHGAVQRRGAEQPRQGGGQIDGGRNAGGSSLFIATGAGRPARLAGSQAGIDGSAAGVAGAGATTLGTGAAGAAGDAGALPEA
jgi:hypothetical protein